MTENERTLKALLADSCRELGEASPEHQAERHAKRLADADVLAVSYAHRASIAA